MYAVRAIIAALAIVRKIRVRTITVFSSDGNKCLDVADYADKQGKKNEISHFSRHNNSPLMLIMADNNVAFTIYIEFSPGNSYVSRQYLLPYQPAVRCRTKT